MKATIDQVREIKAGTSKTFQVDHPRELQSARSIASYTGLSYPELGVRFSCSIDRANNEVTISATAVPKPKKQKGAKA